MMKRPTTKRTLLTGAAVAVMMLTFAAAPAMALPPGQVITDPPGTIAPPDPPVSFCAKHPEICGRPDQPPINVAPPEDPPTSPPTDPPTSPPTDPPTSPPTDPPANPNPSGNTNEGGNSNAGGTVGGSYDTDSVSGIFDRGGALISDLVPNTFTNTVSGTGNSVKQNLPASVDKSLPNTGGGWSFLLLATGALVAGGFVLRSITRRTTRATHSTH